jgi:hypothetical protein
MVRLNIIYDLLQTTKNSSGTVDVKREKHTDRIYFMICNSCYWCATYFGIDVSLSSPLVCHGCGLHNTELMPISTDDHSELNIVQKEVWG